MSVRAAKFVGVLSIVAGAAAAACSSSSPSQPSAAAGGGNQEGLSASVTVPRPLLPGNGGQVQYSSQPVTLTVQNAVLTRTGSTTYTFEVATDQNFANKVQTKEAVAEGGGGQTSVNLDALAAATDYYWHARASGGGTTGLFSATYKFTVGPTVVIGAPAPIGPLSGATTAPRPAFRVANASRSGPVGAITYRFDVAMSPDFGSIVASTVVNEGINETGFIPGSDLPLNVALFWRATAIDASNGVSSTASPVQTFTAKAYSQAEAVAAELGIALWPGAQPPGETGHSLMGGGWTPQILHYVPGNVYFQSPDIEMVRFFDLFDRGFDPEGAISWLNAHGYSTIAQWYPGPEKAVLGLRYVYIAARGKIVVNATWDIVLRVE